MRKIILMFISIIFISGCTLFGDDASTIVKDYFDKYNELDELVISELDNFLESQLLTEHQKEIYNKTIENQYQDLKYEIIEIEYDGNSASVEVNIEVYDLYSAQKEARKYLDSHYEEFLDENNEYNEGAYTDYKLDKMYEQSDTVSYTLEIELDKTDDGNWYIMQLDDEELEKIHGIYNYES